MKKQNHALPIAMMFALFFMIAFVTGLQNPMGVIVKNQFGTSNLLSQLGNAATFIAYLFMGIPAGLLLQRIGYKRTALTAICVGFVGVSIIYLSGIFGSFGIYLAGAFVSGFSMCMLNTVVNPMLNTLGGGGNKGNQLIQMGGVISSIGATLVPALVGVLMGELAQAHIGNATPALFLAMAIFVVAFTVLSFVKIPEPHISPKKSDEKEKHSPLSFRHFVLGAVAVFVYVGVEVGIPNMTNLYMTTGLGMNAATAGTIVGTYWFLMLVGRLIGASLGAKVSGKTMLVFSTSLAMVLVVVAIFCPLIEVNMPVLKSDLSVGIADVPLNVLFLILCGLCTSVMWGGIFNLAVEGLGKYTAAASGIFMVMVCGGGILPLVQGFVADNATFLNSFWVIFVAVAYIFWYAIFGSKNVNKDIVTD